MTMYAYIIDNDYTDCADDSINEQLIVGCSSNDKNIKETHLDLKDKLDNGEGYVFKLCDDDGEMYFRGRMISTEEFGGNEFFAPLDGIGADYGCTEIQYFINNKWEKL